MALDYAVAALTVTWPVPAPRLCRCPSPLAHIPVSSHTQSTHPLTPTQEKESEDRAAREEIRELHATH
ncbi:MAG: hypothetical protein ACK55Z_07780, partial [bacterium]